MRRKLLLFTFAVPFFCLRSQVNPVAYGKVEKAPPFSICMDRAKHVFACSNLRLRSTAVNLDQYVGKYVKAEGPIFTLNRYCVTMTVKKVIVVSERLETGGNWTPGGNIDYRTYARPGTFAFLYMAPGMREVIPLGSLGTFYLNPYKFSVIGSGIIPGSGVWKYTIPIPNLPWLKGLGLIFQPGLLDPRVPSGAFINACCVKIK